MDFTFADFIYFTLLLYVVSQLYQMFSDFNAKLKKLKKTPPLSQQSKVGDYVFFEGKLAMPEIKTPYGKQSCGYYGTVVKAEFKAKKKKPESGTVTARPTLQRLESDELPFLVKQDDLLVHFAMKDIYRMMINLESSSKYYSQPPSAEVRAVAKPKHKKFVVKEFWLPTNTNIVLWGNVIERNQHCITLSYIDQYSGRLVASHGNADSIYQHFIKQKRKITFSLIFLTLMILPFWYCSRQTEEINSSVLILFAGVATVSGMWVEFIKKSPFKTPSSK